jgi:hypothetical protein
LELGQLNKELDLWERIRQVFQMNRPDKKDEDNRKLIEEIEAPVGFTSGQSASLHELDGYSLQ